MWANSSAHGKKFFLLLPPNSYYLDYLELEAFQRGEEEEEKRPTISGIQYPVTRTYLPT